MTLRRIEANPITSAATVEQLPNPNATQPAIWIDDENGSIYIGGVIKLSSGQSAQFTGAGVGEVFGFPSLVDINADNSDSWALTIRNAACESGEGLSIYVDETGDVVFANTDPDGNQINALFFRGVADGSYIRFGPDPNNGIAIGPTQGTDNSSIIALDGQIIVNAVTGRGMQFSSLGGGGVILKPAVFATDIPTQLLPNADGTIPVFVAPPASAISAGIPNSVAFDATHFYVCIAPNTWVRSTLATW